MNLLPVKGVYVSRPYKLASRHFRQGFVVQLGKGVAVGGEQVVVMAGPCSVESAEQIETIAALVAKAGVRVLRGGAFKPDLALGSRDWGRSGRIRRSGGSRPTSPAAETRV